MNSNSPQRRQHFLPCCYLQFFSQDPRGRKSTIYLFDGQKSTKTTVASVGLENYTYSKQNPSAAEIYFSDGFEGKYPPIAEKICGNKRLTPKERFELFIFALVTKCRSPSYKIESTEERIECFSSIMWSLCNEIELMRPDDKIVANFNNYLDRIFRRYSLQVLRLKSAIWVSDNPVIIYGNSAIFGTAVTMPVSPVHIVIFYQRKHLVFNKNIEISARDIAHLIQTQSQNRMRHLYFSSDLSRLLESDKRIPPPAENPSSVTREEVNHTYSLIENIFGFISEKNEIGTR